MKVYMLCFKPPHRDCTDVLIVSSDVNKVEKRMKETLNWALVRYGDYAEYDFESCVIPTFRDDFGCTYEECIQNHSVEVENFSLYIIDMEMI